MTQQPKGQPHPLEQSLTQLLRRDARGGGEQRRRSSWSRKDAPTPPPRVDTKEESLQAPNASEMRLPSDVADPSESLRENRASPVIRKGKRYSLPVLLDGHVVASTPDYGSDVEAIDHALAKRLGLTITSSEAARKKVRLGNGDYLKPLGTVSAWIEFAKGPKRARVVTLSVFSKLITGVQLILGRRFLDETETLTKHRDRLDECRPDHSKVPRLMLMLGSARFLPCFLDNHKVHAIADTGSDVCLVSGDYARWGGLRVEPVGENERHVDLPGGQRAELSGKVRLKFDTLHAARPPDESGPTSVAHDSANASTFGNEAIVAATDDAHYQTFYVLPALPYNVLLGEELLDSIDVFGSHLDSFVDCDHLDGNIPELRAIKWSSRLERLILKAVRKDKSSTKNEDIDSCQNAHSVRDFLQVDSNRDFDTQPKFRQALSLRDAEEWSRRCDAEAELREILKDEQASTDVLVHARLKQKIAAFRQDEARLQDDYKLARLKAEKAWADWHANKHQSPSAP